MQVDCSDKGVKDGTKRDQINSPKTVDELDAEIKALLAQREAALVASKEADLETVKRLCR